MEDEKDLLNAGIKIEWRKSDGWNPNFGTVTLKTAHS